MVAQVAATNGHDPTRRINVLGYCRSVDMLSEVRHSVARRGVPVLQKRERSQLSVTGLLPLQSNTFTTP